MQGSDDPNRQLAYWLHRNLSYRDPGRYSPDFVHASEVTRENPEFCPREWALYDITGKRPREQSITAATAVTHAVGHMYQRMVTEWLEDQVLGTFKCLCGWKEEFSKRWVECPECGAVPIYEEMRFTSRVSGTSCGVDLLWEIPVGMGSIEIVEVKSLKQDEFKALVMPHAEHRTRTSLYLRVIEESGDYYKKVINTQRARILYVSKGGWGQKNTGIMKWKIPHDGPWSPFKEFVIERNDETTEPYHQAAKELHEFRQNDGPMPQGICPTQFCRRAKGCPVVGTCFMKGGRL